MADRRKNKKPTNLRALKARLVSRGLTIREFAGRHNIPASTVYAALSGRRSTGARARSIYSHIQKL